MVLKRLSPYGFIDGTRVGGTQGSDGQYSFASAPFINYEIGSNNFSASLYVRSKARADNLRDAIVQAAMRRDHWIDANDSTTDPQSQAYDLFQIHQLNILIHQFQHQLEQMLTLVGTQNLGFTVVPSQLNISVARTGAAQSINVASMISPPGKSPLKLVSVTNGSRSLSVGLNTDGTVTYTPDSTKSFRVYMADTSPTGAPANGNIDYGRQFARMAHHFSGSDRYLIFSSKATNLDPHATSGVTQGYVRDLVTGKVSWITPGFDGSESTVAEHIINMSDNGQWITFETNASGVLPGLQNVQTENVYLRDRITGTLELVSVGSDGVSPANQDANIATDLLSGDGNIGAFFTSATNILPGQTASTLQMYERNFLTGETVLMGRDSQGHAGNGSVNDGYLSQDGRYTVFTSSSTGSAPFVPTSVADNTYCGGSMQVYLHDRGDSTTRENTKLVSTDSNGNLGTSSSCSSQITPDGKFVEFETVSKLVPDASGNQFMSYVKNVQTGAVTRLVNAYNGGEPDQAIEFNVHGFSPDLRYATSITSADNMIPPPFPSVLQGQQECYFTDHQSNQNVPVNVDARGNIYPNCLNAAPSTDGLSVAVKTDQSLTGVNDGYIHLYLVTKTDQFTYTATDQQGNTVTGTVTLTEPLTGTTRK